MSVVFDCIMQQQFSCNCCMCGMCGDDVGDPAGETASNAVEITGKKRGSNVLCADGGALAMSPSKISRGDASACAHSNSITSNAVESPQSRKRRLACEHQRRQRISTKSKSDETLKALAAQKASLRALETNEKRKIRLETMTRRNFERRALETEDGRRARLVA